MTSWQTVARAVWWMVLLRGVLAVLFGLVALLTPGIALLTLVFVFGFYALCVAEIAEAFGARRRGTPAWGWTLAAGVLGVLFGIALIVQPAAGILALLWLLGTFALVVGVVLIVWAFRIRSAVRSALPR